jgi:hypothetical protein
VPPSFEGLNTVVEEVLIEKVGCLINKGKKVCLIKNYYEPL